MTLFAAVIITAVLLGMVLMVAGMLLDQDWLVVLGGALAIGALLVVLGKGMVDMWVEVLSEAT